MGSRLWSFAFMIALGLRVVARVYGKTDALNRPPALYRFGARPRPIDFDTASFTEGASTTPWRAHCDRCTPTTAFTSIIGGWDVMQYGSNGLYSQRCGCTRNRKLPDYNYCAPC